MYLHVKNHTEDKFPGTQCVRGDSSVSTGILINKIKGDIEEADVIIADCSGHNPNVFYELGVAHAVGKQVLLINSDSQLEVPTDIRAYDQLMYSFNDDEIFCSRLTQALQGLFGRRFDELYSKAEDYLQQFCKETGRAIQAKDKETFRNDVMAKESAKKLPPLDNNRLLATFSVAYHRGE
jgi:hypothetical protein